MAFSVLQIGYYQTLLETRQVMLEHDGYRVTSALGNDQGMEVAGSGDFDVIVVGFSAGHPERTTMVQWLKQHIPGIPVVALLAHRGEMFPDADGETFSEDPLDWLVTVRQACVGRQ
jgi:DNA-binding NtrC family response regulator